MVEIRALMKARTASYFCLVLGLLSRFPTASHAQSGERPAGFDAVSHGYYPSYTFLRDTLFLLDTVYLEVRLDQQMIYRHSRGGRVERFPCSTGNPAIKDAIATRPGIFSVQWKSKRHFSTQFEVYLNYWMPFNGGIGFHGLQGRSYYKYLGRKRSSHGCVRISNETGAKLFPATPTGTVVYVHSGSPARVLRFADTTRNDYTILEDVDMEFELLERRLEAVQRRDWRDSSLRPRLALPARSRFADQIDVGSVRPLELTHFPLPLIADLPVPKPEKAIFRRAKGMMIIEEMDD